MKRVDDQWSEALLFLSEALKSGLGLEEALLALRAEAPEPLRTKMERALSSATWLPLPTRIAMLFSDPHLALAKAVLILSHQTGGKTAGLLEKAAHILRAKLELHEKAATMSAQGRVSAWIVGLSPITLLAAFLLFSPDFVAPLFQTKSGWITLVSIVVLIVAGLYFVHRAARLEP